MKAKLVNESLNEFIGEAPDMSNIVDMENIVIDKLMKASDIYGDLSAEQAELYGEMTGENPWDEDNLMEKYPFLTGQIIVDLLEDVAMNFGQNSLDIDEHMMWIDEEHGIPEEIQLKIYNDFLDYCLNILENI